MVVEQRILDQLYVIEPRDVIEAVDSLGDATNTSSPGSRAARRKEVAVGLACTRCKGIAVRVETAPHRSTSSCHGLSRRDHPERVRLIQHRGRLGEPEPGAHFVVHKTTRCRGWTRSGRTARGLEARACRSFSGEGVLAQLPRCPLRKTAYTYHLAHASPHNGMSPMPTVKAVLFDYGLVLSGTSRSHRVGMSLSASWMQKKLRFAAAYWKHRHDYDSGKLNHDSYWRSVAADLGHTLDGPGACTTALSRRTRTSGPQRPISR